MSELFKRDELKFKGRARQINSFLGLIRRRNITPTDIDGIIDYHGKAFIILEGKYGDAELPKGQKIALENLANAILESKRQVVVIIFRHHVHDINNDIIVSEQIVSDIYYKKKWETITAQKNVIEVIQMFENYCDMNNFKI
ncbi:hypothetical protein EBS40_09330 [bacterium]|nr:hypothetical protein [bacterium]